MTAAYRLTAVQIDYDGRHALDIDSLDLFGGRITAVVGANGSGKSTLLRLLAFLLPPSSGEIAFFGEAIRSAERDLVDLRRRVTLVAQQPLLFHRSVRANLAYGLRIRRQAVSGQIERALDRVGLSGFADRPATALSGGEAARVALARALVLEPTVLLLDEPTASVDESRIADLEQIFRSLAAGGTTVVPSTHDIDQAHRLADDVHRLDRGRLAPAPRTNVLHGTTVSQDDTPIFVSGELRVVLAETAPCRTIAIHPDDIAVSLAPIESSARNRLAGRISKIVDDGGTILVTADCGKPLTARLTRKSYRDLGLAVGMRVHYTFKASAVHLIDARPSPC